MTSQGATDTASSTKCFASLRNYLNTFSSKIRREDLYVNKKCHARRVFLTTPINESIFFSQTIEYFSGHVGLTLSTALMVFRFQ